MRRIVDHFVLGNRKGAISAYARDFAGYVVEGVILHEEDHNLGSGRCWSGPGSWLRGCPPAHTPPLRTTMDANWPSLTPIVLEQVGPCPVRHPSSAARRDSPLSR